MYDEVGGECAEYAEYRAARAHGDCGLVEQVAERAAGQSRQQVDGGEARATVHAFDQPAEYEEGEAVEEEVQQVGVQEHGGEEAPVFACGDERSEHRAEAQQQVHILVEEAADELHKQPYGYVDGEEQPGYDDSAVRAGQHKSCVRAFPLAFTRGFAILESLHRPPPSQRLRLRQRADAVVVYSR